MPRKVFNVTMQALKAIGLTPPAKGLTYRLWTIWNCIVIFAGIEFTILYIHGTITSDVSIYLKLEYISFFYTNVSMSSRVIWMTMRKKELFSLFEKVEALLQHMEITNGTNSLSNLKRKLKLFAYGYACSCAAICANAYLIAYVKYYFEGIEDPLPFEAPIPFEKKNNIHAVVWYEVFQFYSSVGGLTVINICLMSLSLAFAEIMKNLAECYERIDVPNGDFLLRQTIEWHSKVIGLVNETNSLLATSLVIDYLLSIQYISVCGFLLVKVGLTNSTSFSKYSTLYCGFLSAPFAVCLGGHLVTKQNDVLYNSLINNNWYRLAPQARRNLILPTLISSKGLYWNYRGVLRFDMSLYLAIVKQSYSLIAFLKIVS